MASPKGKPAKDTVKQPGPTPAQEAAADAHMARVVAERDQTHREQQAKG